MTGVNRAGWAGIVVLAGLNAIAAGAAPADAPASGPAGARVYVSPQGDDGNPGTSPDKPLRTIGKAAELVAPGTTVHLAPGTYAGRVVLTRSGTAEAPIVFRKDGNGEVVWTMSEPDPAKWDEKFALSLEGRKHVVLDGITFRDCGAWLFMFDTENATIRNCVFDGCRIYNGVQLKNASYNRFLNCRFVKAISIKEWKKMSDWWHQPAKGADYIEIYFNSHHNLVQDCQFGEIAHVGVSVAAFQPGHTPRYNIIRNCTFRDPVWKCMGTGASEYTLIENNVCTGTAAMFIQLQSPKTIVRRNLFHGYREVREANAHENLHSAISISSPNDRNTPCYAQHNRIYNNLFYDNDKCTASFTWKGPVMDNLFKNNILYRNRRTIFLPVPDYKGANKNYFLRNVLLGADPGQKIVQLSADTFTLAEAQTQLPDLYKDNLEVDPQFVDPEHGDFRLKKDSPCIDAGAHLTFAVADGSGTEVAVDDPLYFCDGFGLIEPDSVVVGSNKPAKIVQVDYEKKVLKVGAEISWKKGDPVNLPYEGAGPDIGPFERPPGPGLERRKAGP